MNNFSPSTDTSVGTKRFTAQEVQLAYTLMAVEYMKTIKGLNPNHQLVDKAVKLKALGFTNSKEVGDAITSEEDLKVLKCYSFLQAKISEYNQIALDAMRAKNLFSFVKRAREVFGESTLLVGSKQFDDVCKKYKLVKGLLKQYTGVIPDRNIREILEVKRKLNGEGPMFSDLGLEYANGAYYYVTGINYGYSDSETMLNNLKKYIESHNHIVIGPDTEGTLRLSSIINKNPGLPADVKAFSYPNIVSFDAVKIGRNELFVACPPSQLNNPEVTITKKAVDPIVYQPCAYGILIHSMWGEESEDKVFEEYKRINNLML